MLHFRVSCRYVIPVMLRIIKFLVQYILDKSVFLHLLQTARASDVFPTGLASRDH